MNSFNAKLKQIFPPRHPAGWINRLRGLWIYRTSRRDWMRKEDWARRLAVAKQCRENDLLTQIDGAGGLHDGGIRMHNDLFVEAGGYYGPSANVLLTGNRGVHEPQEEYLFREVLRQLPAGSTMLELGAYWGFYSMWFKRDVPDSRCYLVEAETGNMAVGIRNFRRNQLQPDGTLLARIGRSNTAIPEAIPTMTVDEVLRHFALSHLTLLHADIQGHEFNMLLGANEALVEKRIDIMFISTHSMGVHYRCKAHLEKFGYVVPWSVDLIDSYSFDGLLVAHLPGSLPETNFPVSLRSATL